MASSNKVKALPFFMEWAGHPVSGLSQVLQLIREAKPDRPVVFLAGDSSLDNKAWIPSTGPGSDPLPIDVPAVYHQFIEPPIPKPDVAFWMNHLLGADATCLNTAVEASLLRHRDEELLAHDQFIRDNIQAEDVLIVSVGANDIALSPTASTTRHMAQLAWLTSRSSIENGTASSLKHFSELFGDKTKTYISRLIEEQKPRAVIACMIYFPLEGQQSSWAETQLKMLGYNRDPGQLQAAIRKMYEQATAKLEIEGTKVIPCALYEAMDGKSVDQYVARVEPSVEGGRRMAELLVGHLNGILKAS